MPGQLSRIPLIARGLTRMVRDHGTRHTIKYIGTRINDRLLSRRGRGLPTIYAQAPLSRNPLVSIILPIYNHAEFLPHAIKSVLAQTYQNWELIVVNDGSSDDFQGAILPFLPEKRIRIVNQKNLKLPAALNNGFRYAVGEYFTWTSADNIMLPNQIEVLVRALELNPNYGLAYSDYTAIDDRGAPLNDPYWRMHNRPDGSARLHLPEQVTLRNFHDSGDNFLGASFLWRADVHDLVGAHDENCLGGEDYDFWLRMSVVTPFLHVPFNLYEYRVHDNTLNARAAELKIHDNVQRLLSFDRERRAALLRNPDVLLDPADTHSYLRDTRQYSSYVGKRLTFFKYSQLDGAHYSNTKNTVALAIDVPINEIDPAKLEGASIIVTDDAFTYRWIKRLGYPLTKRIIKTPCLSLSSSVHHAAALTLYESDKEETGYSLTQNALPISGTIMPIKHILLLVTKWGKGGLEQVVLDVAAGAKQAGIDVTIGSTDETDTQLLRAACGAIGVNCIGFSCSALAVRDFVKNNSVDVVNYHHASLGAKLISDMGIPTIYTVHNCYIWHNSEKLNETSVSLEPMDMFIAVSRQVAAYANRWLKAPPEKIYVIPNGTTLPGNIKLDNSRGSEIFRFICTASIMPLKCQIHLVRAFEKVHEVFPNTRLTLLGYPADEAYHTALQQEISIRGLENSIEVIPGLERGRALETMAKADCMIQPSVIEGWSIAAAEAMLLGLPVIVTDVGSAYDMKYLSDSVRIIKGKIPDILDLTGDTLYSTLLADDQDFDNRIAIEMILAVKNRDTMKVAAIAAVSKAQDLFSMGKAISSYLNLFSTAK
ncbi:glycosyltransferase [Brucella intermedia]|uniref:glycosyltransferase n=2 Tax=Brucella intermedia TaxID=94625 RepID=UPI000468C591|nr:glycosyltransferase [Brucella intermedia]